MRLEKVQEALKTKKIQYEYTEENGCGSIDFMFRGLRFHIWEYEDRVWGAETNVFEAGRSQDIEGDYEETISREILSWPDMLPGMSGCYCSFCDICRRVENVKSNVSITTEGSGIYEKI